MIEIKHKTSGLVLHTVDAETLRCADLNDIDLRCADLNDIDLRGADLSYADLSYADLSYADLRGADLRGADLRRADIRGANLSGANLSGANLSGADLRGAMLPDGCTVMVPDIDRRMAEVVQAEGNSLDMANWHTCDTSHCRAGWAIVLAGDAGVMMEEEHGPEAAGAMIYAASRPDKLVPDFYASDEDAMASILEDAR